MTWTLLLLVAYSVLQIGLGIWIGRRVRGSADFFVAGRSLGPGLLFSTMLAANIGAGSTVGAAGLGYRDGLSAWWWVGSAAMGSFMLAWWIGPAIRRIAAAHDLRTVGDYLEFRYSASVRGIVALLLWFGTLAILAGQLIALAWVLNAVIGVPKFVGCLMGGAVVTAYFTAGGLLTSAWVNLVQVCVKIAGFAIALPMAIIAVGGVSGLVATAPQAPEYWNLWHGGQSGWMYLAMLGPAFVISPGLLQKIYGARDDRTVRIGVGSNAMALLLFAFVPTTMGMIARALHPSLSNHELALPTLLSQDLPPAVGALGLAALFSAEVSTADALLFMLATSLSQDLYKRFVRPAATDRQVLAVARLAAIGGGIGGVSLAIVSPTIIGALSVFYSVLGVCLFVPIIAGLFFPAVGTPEALTSIIVGVGTMTIAMAVTGKGVFGLTPQMMGLAAAVVGCGLSAVVRRNL